MGRRLAPARFRFFHQPRIPAVAPGTGHQAHPLAGIVPRRPALSPDARLHLSFARRSALLSMSKLTLRWGAGMLALPGPETKSIFKNPFLYSRAALAIGALVVGWILFSR